LESSLCAGLIVLALVLAKGREARKWFFLPYLYEFPCLGLSMTISFAGQRKCMRRMQSVWNLFLIPEGLQGAVNGNLSVSRNNKTIIDGIAARNVRN